MGLLTVLAFEDVVKCEGKLPQDFVDQKDEADQKVLAQEGFHSESVTNHKVENFARTHNTYRDSLFGELPLRSFTV